MKRDMNDVLRELSNKRINRGQVYIEYSAWSILSDLGLQYDGIQEGIKSIPDMVLFTDKWSDSTLAVPVPEVNSYNVLLKVAESRAAFIAGERRNAEKAERQKEHTKISLDKGFAKV